MARPVVLITGGAKRIGRSIALAFAAAGYDVALHYRSAHEDAAQTARSIEEAGVRCTHFKVDLALPEAPRRLLSLVREQHPRIHCLVNNASVYTDDRLETFEEDELVSVLRINFLAPVALIEGLLEPAGEAPLAVVNITDARTLAPVPHHFSYYVSKQALAGMTRYLARELAPRARVNAIAPGLTLRSIFADEAGFNARAAAMPLGIAASPEDIAAAALYFARATSVSGQTLVVDSGSSLC